MKLVSISAVFVAAATARKYKPPLNQRYQAVRQRPFKRQPVVTPKTYDNDDDSSIWGYKPKPYLLDARPAATKPVHTGMPSFADADCKINPWLLMAFLEHDPSPPVVVSQSALTKTYGDKWPANSLGLDFVMNSLQGCHNNQKVRDVFAIDFLMKDKPELYGALAAGSTDAEKGYNTYKVGDVKGKFAGVKDLLQLEGTKPFKDWSASKVYLNMYKWKVYNGLYSDTPMFAVKHLKDQYTKFKAERVHAKELVKKEQDARATKDKLPSMLAKLDEVKHWAPYLPPAFKNRFWNRG